MKEQTKCYCGHTTYCDCGPETIEEATERLKGKELFKESNDRARKILSEIKSLPIQETLEEVAERIYPTDCTNWSIKVPLNERKAFVECAKWQQEVSQHIVPFDAYNIEVFKIEADENGVLFAYIGYRITNGNFHFSVVPFTEPQQNKNKYSEEEVEDFIYKVCGTVARLQGITLNGNHIDTAYKQFKKK